VAAEGKPTVLIAEELGDAGAPMPPLYGIGPRRARRARGRGERAAAIASPCDCRGARCRRCLALTAALRVAGLELLTKGGANVDCSYDMKPEDLCAKISLVDALIVRSGTKASPGARNCAAAMARLRPLAPRLEALPPRRWAYACRRRGPARPGRLLAPLLAHKPRLWAGSVNTRPQARAARLTTTPPPSAPSAVRR
jgi:hypothetical protein